jgi:CMP-N-acetylneuraminic acid synthetase
MAAKDAGLDDEMKGDVIEWFTFGDTRSGKVVNDQQAADLFLVFHKIRRQQLDIRYDENGKLYLEKEDGKRWSPKQ